MSQAETPYEMNQMPRVTGNNYNSNSITYCDASQQPTYYSGGSIAPTHTGGAGNSKSGGNQYYFGGGGGGAGGVVVQQPPLPYQFHNAAAASNYYGNSNIDRAYTIVNTEPITVSKDRPIILVDPILERHIKSYLTFSVFNMLFCCFLGGLITTCMSCNVMRLNDDKRYKEAFKLSGKVLLANMIATAAGVALYLLIFQYIYLAIYPYLPKLNY